MLTDTSIRNAEPGKASVKLTDGKGLYIEFRPTGAKLWRYRYRINGKENLFALGEYPGKAIPDGENDEARATRIAAGVLTLAEARQAREDARRQVKQGVHPSQARKLDKIRQANEANSTFRAVLGEWIDNRHWAPNTKANRMSQIEMHLLPAIGDLPIRQVTAAHILDLLKRAEKKESDTRSRKQGADTRIVGGGTVVLRLRQIIAGTFDHAVATLRADTNPALSFRRAFKVPRVTHKVPLTRAQVGELLRVLDDYPSIFQTGAALRLLWLTLARPSEMAGAEWAEFDLDAATWTIPGERMKMSKEHVMPLPTQAVVELRRLQALSGHRKFVFTHRDRRDEHMSSAAMNKGIVRLKLAFEFTPHAARTTASTLLNEMGYRGEVIESQLAHQERNAVRRAYSQATYLEERRAMMQQWADMTDNWREGAQVVPIRGGKTA